MLRSVYNFNRKLVNYVQSSVCLYFSVSKLNYRCLLFCCSYCDLRRLVYMFASGGFSSRHLQALSDLIASLMNLCPARPKQYMSIGMYVHQ